MLNSLVSLKPKTHYEAVTNQVKTKQKNYGDVRLYSVHIFVVSVLVLCSTEPTKRANEMKKQTLTRSSFRHLRRLLACLRHICTK